MHDFTVVDLFTVTNVSSTIGGLSRLVIRLAHSGGIEGSISNIIVSIDDINIPLYLMPLKNNLFSYLRLPK